MTTNRTLPLTKLPIGRHARLRKASVDKQMAHRLAELGLTPGVPIVVLQDSGGPLLVVVRDSRIALGRKVADQLNVEML